MDGYGDWIWEELGQEDESVNTMARNVLKSKELIFSYEENIDSLIVIKFGLVSKN